MKILRNIANRNVMVPLGIVFVTFTFFVFPYYQQKINDVANKELITLDARVQYNKIAVVTLFENAGVAGRAYLRVLSGKIDMVYPIIYGSLFLLLIILLTKKWSNQWSLLVIFPVIAMIFDYFENLNVLHLLDDYPSISIEDVACTEKFTQLKWLCITITLLVIMILSISNAIKHFRK